MDANSSDKSHILVVDDDAMNRELMEAVLETADFDVTLTNSIESAWEIIQNQSIDAALVDVRLQSETDGYKLTRQIKENAETSRIKVAIITALETDQERDLAMQAGADLFLSRMLKMSEIIKQIVTMMENDD